MNAQPLRNESIVHPGEDPAPEMVGEPLAQNPQENEEVLEQATMFSMPDDTVPGEAPLRSRNLFLRAPCPVHIINRKSVWLGFRLGPSRWPGYFRLALAADNQYNVATFDIHKSDFAALRTAIERITRGLPASVRFTAGAQMASMAGRKTATTALVEFMQHEGRITILGQNMEQLVMARGWAPDLREAFSMIPAMLDSIPSGPTLKSLRTAPKAALILGETGDADNEQPPLHITKRYEDTRREIVIRLNASPLMLNQKLIDASSISFDFSDYPPCMYVEENKPMRIHIFTVNPFDLQAMLRTQNDELWTLRSRGQVRVDIPHAQRAAVLKEIETMFTDAEEFRPKKMVELQSSFDFGMSA